MEEKAEIISSCVTKVPLGTWKDVEDKVDKLKQRTTDLIAHMAEVGIILDDIPGWPNTKLAVSQAENSVQEASNELKFEDTERELHSNATFVKEKVPYPLFEGREETKIKELLRGNAETNARELLQGNVENHIPDTMEIIDDIYKALGRAFGDPTRLLNYKKKYLTKLGALPSYDTKGGTKVVVDWYLELETQLQGLLDLGQANSDNEDLTSVIYSLDTIRTVANLFEKQEGDTVLAAVKDQRGRVHLQALKDEISKRRTSAQQWLHSREFAQTNPGLGKKPGTSSITTNFNSHIPKSLITYNPPK